MNISRAVVAAINERHSKRTPLQRAEQELCKSLQRENRRLEDRIASLEREPPTHYLSATSAGPYSSPSANPSAPARRAVFAEVKKDFYREGGLAHNQRNGFGATSLSSLMTAELHIRNLSPLTASEKATLVAEHRPSGHTLKRMSDGEYVNGSTHDPTGEIPRESIAFEVPSPSKCRKRTGASPKLYGKPR